MVGSSIVKVIEDSVSPEGFRVTSIHARYWRAIHAELMTHRKMSKNARSSRAVPSKILLTEPIFIPQFGMNQPGMQSEILAPPELQEKWAREWEQLAQRCRDQVRSWSEERMHKQHANRPLEWFGWIDVLISATSWNNFFELRISKYAQPEFDELARNIQIEMSRSVPRLLQPGEWHLPYVLPQERIELSLDMQQKLSVARSARLSYTPFDGQANWEAELQRYNNLVVSSPVHASPAEHQATPDHLEWGTGDSYNKKVWKHPELHGNLDGWVQYRKTLPNEWVPG